MSEIGSRMKRYEAAYNQVLTPRTPLIIRVDGKSFHTFTRGCKKPYDQRLINAMVAAAIDTARQMSGFKLAYVQSDECNFLLTDYDTLQTQGWFNYELNKVVSISAAIYTAAFNKHFGSTDATFDSRAFNMPEEDVPNLFIWRQRDWERNSIQMLAQSVYSQPELQGKKIPQIHEMLFAKGLNWAKLSDQLKNGTFIYGDLTTHNERLDYGGIAKIYGGTDDTTN